MANIRYRLLGEELVESQGMMMNTCFSNTTEPPFEKGTRGDRDFFLFSINRLSLGPRGTAFSKIYFLISRPFKPVPKLFVSVLLAISRDNGDLLHAFSHYAVKGKINLKFWKQRQ